VSLREGEKNRGKGESPFRSLAKISGRGTLKRRSFRETGELGRGNGRRKRGELELKKSRKKSVGGRKQSQMFHWSLKSGTKGKGGRGRGV